VEIIKPQNDRRNYRRILLPNQLQVLLISDPETDKCAASMNVRVGYFNDPEGLEGLAHFLEHMLFYASEKYPLEDSYSRYISEHGGTTNAFTSSEKTNYHFDVNPDCFEEALDRFAQFFIKPLMSADATTREIKAVESENQMNLLSDAWRMNQLQKHLSLENHPYHKFGSGNWETLEVRPKMKGLDTRQELLRFYHEHYSANLMHLVVYGKDGLDEIERLVKCKFQDIPNKDRNCTRFPGQPCDSRNLSILVKVVPIEQGHKLTFIWPITPGFRNYKEGPTSYLSHLIGHEGEGSLFYILKKLGWATSLLVGESESSYEFSFFKVVIVLTDAGHDHFQDTAALLFKYIHLLQLSGPSGWIHDELVAICQTSFHYQDKIRPIDYARNVAINMQFYPPNDWLAGSSLPSKFNAEKLEFALKELSPENVRIFWESTKFEGLTDLKEPWYGTAYSVERIAESTIEKWIERAPNEDLHLPVPNVFIPTDLSLKSVPNPVKFPTLLRKSAYSRLWYKPDTAFSSPKEYVMIDFNCPHSGISPESVVLTEIFTRLVMDYLNEYAYYAEVAGLHYSVKNTHFGFQVTVVGYSHKLKILLDKVIKTVTSFEVKHERFVVIQEQVLKEYQNVKFQQPYQQAMYCCSLILQTQIWPWSDKLELLPYLEAESLIRFYPLMLSRAFLECYVAGNMNPNEAESIVLHLEEVFFKGPSSISQALFASQHMTNRIIKLESGLSYIYNHDGLNPSDKNSALVHYIQVYQDDFKLNAKLQLFALAAKQSAFHQLRSVEQLGYITVLMHRNDCGIRGLQFIIQSNVKGPGKIDQRIESFLKMFETQLYEMSIDDFKSNVAAVIEMKLEKHKNLREESRFFWNEIADGTLKFDRREREVEALKDLSQKELIDFFDKYIKVGAPFKKSLSVRIYASAHSSDLQTDVVEENGVRIEDIFSFKRSRPLYGSFKGHVKL
ncbi:insulin degrading enzyme, partial [Genlisea aurea]